ncbi:prephenate dehydratase [Formicincola oecophyllae]|uniref:prephenate dehydratase n=1 Tax=Formicincola oecophyllae TaxID=2558361 RepID=A0A4Y6UAH8_9PROT|nr:prephenate dehydratase [Formicincola oecophyllae]
MGNVLGTIAFQGRPGAYSDLAARQARPGWATLPCPSFAAAINAVRFGQADEALLPCENTLAGRVPEIHALLPDAALVLVGEHFMPIHHCLLALPGTPLGAVRRVHTHPVALLQIRDYLAAQGLEGVSAFDTAGAAELVASWGDPSQAAVASELAGTLNGLEVLARHVEDAGHNTTRFYLAAPEGAHHPQGCRDAPHGLMTTLIVEGPSVPGALHAMLGGFATHGVNMTRIESYMKGGRFDTPCFLMDVEAAPGQPAMDAALHALGRTCVSVRVLGVYPRSAYRGGLGEGQPTWRAQANPSQTEPWGAPSPGRAPGNGETP